MADDKTKIILVSSGYGVNTRLPFVKIESEDLDHPLQITPETARDLAGNLLKAAEAAETDAFLIEFFKGALHQSDLVAASILFNFRDFRDERRKS